MERVTKRGRRKGYIRAVLLLLIVFAAARSYLDIKANSPRTILAQYGELKMQERVNGVVVREELVIRAPISGRIAYIAQEKVRIPCNAKLVEVIRETIGDDILERYREINRQLEAQKDQQQEGPMLPDRRGVDEAVDSIIDALETGNLSAVYLEKERLKREMSIEGISRRDRLVEEKNRLEQIIQEGVKEVYSPFAGIPVYSIDGYEDILVPEHLSEIDPAQLKPKDVAVLGKGKSVKGGQPVLRLVDNHRWYLVVQLSREFADNLRKGSVVTLDFFHEGYQMIKATVKEIKEVDEGLIVALEIEDYVPGMLEQRFMEVAVVKARYYGYIIPKEALLYRGGSTLVQVLIEGKAVNKRVTVRGVDEKNAVISPDERESQLKLYDRVVINPGE